MNAAAKTAQNRHVTSSTDNSALIGANLALPNLLRQKFTNPGLLPPPLIGQDCGGSDQMMMNFSSPPLNQIEKLLEFNRMLLQNDLASKMANVA